ncbi:MAG: hypothetical protein NTW19_23215 [Planctomycetota bacterium]|nr:hypothetical protein [Planctomycetota bacterium]
MPFGRAMKSLGDAISAKGVAQPRSMWGTLHSILKVGPFTAVRERLTRWLLLLRWFFSSFNRAVAGPRDWRRLLFIYDLESQSFTVGDILEFQAAAMVLRERWGLDKVDYAVIHEGKAVKNAWQWNIDDDNFHARINQILPAAQVNPHLGSLFVFDSHAQFDEFLQDNIRRYQVWPPGATYKLGKNLRGRIYSEVLYDHVQRTGRLPLIQSRPLMLDWAKRFYASHAEPDVLVSVNMRNNPRWDPSRNLDIDVWLRFFNACAGQYPVRFVVTCSKEEIDPRLRACPNVIMAKDHDTTLEQDVALLEISAFNMGASSGLCAKSIFSDAPYSIVRTNLTPEVYRGMIFENGCYRFFGSRPDQIFWPHAETLEFLQAEFARMWAIIDVDAWRAKTKVDAAPDAKA